MKTSNTSAIIIMSKSFIRGMLLLIVCPDVIGHLVFILSTLKLNVITRSNGWGNNIKCWIAGVFQSLRVLFCEFGHPECVISQSVLAHPSATIVGSAKAQLSLAVEKSADTERKQTSDLSFLAKKLTINSLAMDSNYNMLGVLWQGCLTWNSWVVSAVNLLWYKGHEW